VDAYKFSKTLGSYEELVFPMPATKQRSELQPCLFILLRYFLKYISPGTQTMLGERFFFPVALSVRLITHWRDLWRKLLKLLGGWKAHTQKYV